MCCELLVCTTAERDRQGQAAHRQYKLCMVVGVASDIGHAQMMLISGRRSAHDFSVKLSQCLCSHSCPEKWLQFVGIHDHMYLVHDNLHWKKTRTQNGLPQLQDLYHFPVLPQCRVIAFVYSKFQYGMNICIKAHKYSPRAN